MHSTNLFRALGLAIVALALTLGGCDKKGGEAPVKKTDKAPAEAPKKAEPKKVEAKEKAPAPEKAAAADEVEKAAPTTETKKAEPATEKKDEPAADGKGDELVEGPADDKGGEPAPVKKVDEPSAASAETDGDQPGAAKEAGEPGEEPGEDPATKTAEPATTEKTEEPGAKSAGGEPAETATGQAQPSGGKAIMDRKALAALPESELPPKGAAPKVTLLKPGAEPRKQLLWKATKGTKVTLGFDMSIDLETETMGAAPKISMPMKMAMTIVVSDVKPNGNMVFDLVLGDFEVGGMLAQAAPQIKSMMEGMKGTWEMTPAGVVVSGEFKIPPSAEAQALQKMVDSMKQSMEQLSAPLPADPVGVGGVWQTLAQIESNGLVARVVTHYELTELNGDKGKLKITVYQTADEQDMKVPGMPGAKAKVREMTTDGQGTMTLDLASPMASVVDFTAKMAMDSHIEAMGQAQDMKVKSDMRVKITPKE